MASHARAAEREPGCAFLFPGQGTQAVGMGRWLAQTYPDAREVFERADRAVGFNLSGVCFRGPAAELTATELAQPAVVCVALATLEVLGRHELHPSVVAGHSIGEIAALVAAGALRLEDAVVVARRRGELMASIAGDGAMVAVLGLTHAQLSEVCEACEGTVVVALVNSDTACVLSGDRVAVDGASALARERGATHTTPLATSHAFHSPLMAPMVAQWTDVVAALPLQAPVRPLVLNTSGAAATTVDDVRTSLVRQLTAPVRWDRVCATLDGRASLAIEVGASKAVSGMTRRCLPHMSTRTTHDPRSMQRVLDEGARAPV